MQALGLNSACAGDAPTTSVADASITEVANAARVRLIFMIFSYVQNVTYDTRVGEAVVLVEWVRDKVIRPAGEAQE